MPIIIHISNDTVESAAFATDEVVLYNLGLKEAKNVSLVDLYLPTVKHVIELTPPPFPIHASFFRGFFEELVEKFGVEVLDNFEARCYDTEKMPLEQYGLTRYKKDMLKDAAQTKPVQSSEDQEDN